MDLRASPTVLSPRLCIQCVANMAKSPGLRRHPTTSRSLDSVFKRPFPSPLDTSLLEFLSRVSGLSATGGILRGVIAQLNGAHLYYDRTGSGPPLVLVHAGIADSRMWRPQVVAFSPGFDVVTPDLRGFGESSLPRGPFSFSRDLVALLDHLGLEQVALVGCSIGGSICLDVAIARPERVSRLVLVGAGISGANFGAADAHLFGLVREAEKSGDIDALNEMEVRTWVDGLARPAGHTAGPVRDLALAMNGLALRTNWDGATVERLEPPALTRLAEVRCPTLILRGDQDVPHVAVAAAALVEGIAGSRAEVIREAAHLPSLERPDEFNRLLKDFLASG